MGIHAFFGNFKEKKFFLRKFFVNNVKKGRQQELELEQAYIMKPDEVKKWTKAQK